MAKAWLLKLADVALDPLMAAGRVVARIVLLIIELDLLILLAWPLL